MPTRLSLAALAVSTVWLLACAGLGGGKDTDPQDDPPGVFEDKDADDDGYLWDEDCNDANAAIHPGAQEVCDPADVDEDCDGLSDAADDSTSGTITAWHDADGDGFGNPGEPTPVCEVVAGYVVDATDCDDAAPAVNPAAVEVCDALVDNDCDGLYDNGDDSIDDTTRIDVWADEDGDGFGDDDAPSRACFVATGFSDEPGDCDDGDALTNPAAYETCGGADEDCDGTTDEDDAVDAPTWHDDADGDGYGDPDDTTVACDAPTRHVADGTDCDDTTRSNRPGATEYCDEVDNDCDGTTDEDDAVDASTWYADTDGDRYGDPDVSRDACDQPTGYVADATDCNDDSSAVRPGATEVCDSADTDEDCDGAADDADSSVSSSGKRTFYADTDGDGYGRSTGTQRCDGGAGWASTSTDCDDTNASISPAGSEVCDATNADEDCDGRADDSDTSVAAATKTTWYPDADADGYGVPGTTRSQCDQPTLHASNDADCDDGNAGVSPGDAEVCDAADLDEDCDGRADDADPDMPTTSKTGWAVDADGDGWGSDTVSVYSCATPEGYAVTGDCDDGDDVIHPDAADACTDEIDADCDGVTTCGRASPVATFTGFSSSAPFAYQVATFADIDGDGLGDVAASSIAADADAGLVAVLDLGAGSGPILSRDVARIGGVAAGDRVGWSMARVPDVDGDGADDLAVGSYLADSATTTDAGAVYIIASSIAAGTSDDASTLARTAVYGSHRSSGLSYMTIFGLDWDGDGDGEVMALGSGTYSSSGSPYLAYVLDVDAVGATTAEDDALFSVTDGDGDYFRFGGCAGDADGDGRDDVFVRTYETVASDTFGLSLYLSDAGATSLTYADADATWVGGAPVSWASDLYGASCVVADLDGDGHNELVAGAPHYGVGTSMPTRGRIYVYPDATSGGPTSRATATITGPAAYASVGENVVALHGFAGDDGATLAFGHGNTSGGPGEVALFGGGVSGALSTSDAPFTLQGRSADDYFGTALAGGDLDADGLDDLVISALRDDGGGTNTGAVFVYYGADLLEP